MSDYNELIKNFSKIRSYIRDFYLYGFKTRQDYQDKSSRTYDNQRRRMESWFSGYIRYEYHTDHKKSVFITIDNSQIAINPLYRAWKSKSFTANDIMLHFFLLDLLGEGGKWGIEDIADALLQRYQILFDTQVIRRKLTEYIQEGLISASKESRQYLYSLSPAFLENNPQLLPALLDAVSFFQAAAPLGFIGSTILDYYHTSNRCFRFRHNSLVHTLDDEILLSLLTAIKEKRQISFSTKSSKNRNNGKSSPERTIIGVPLKILISTQTGRHYICIHKSSTRRLASYRLDNIRNVKLLNIDSHYGQYLNDFLKNRDISWGVSFGTNRKPETVCLQIAVNEETEKHIIHRLEREKRGGCVTRLKPDLYQYTCSCWDASEMLPWIKTFTGRIFSFTCSNKEVEDRLWHDMETMKNLYINQKKED